MSEQTPVFAPFALRLAERGFIRVSELGVGPMRRAERYCDCAEPDVWVRAESQGNRYRCGFCLGVVLGMEASVGDRKDEG